MGSLLDEINAQVRPSQSLIQRIARVYKSIDFTSGQPVVLPVARHVDPWRSPEEWKIKASPNGGRIARTDMRSLALVASPSLEASLLDFVETHRVTLSRFSLVTSAALHQKVKNILGWKALVLGGDDTVSDRRGGLALLQARVVLESIGGAVIFHDAESAACAGDFASTFRLLNVQDVMVATNRASADAMMQVLDDMVQMREPELMPCFFVTLQSPAVPAYKKQQAALIESLKSGCAAAAAGGAREVLMATTPIGENDENANGANSAEKPTAARSMKAQLAASMDTLVEGESSESFRRQLTRRTLTNTVGATIGRSGRLKPPEGMTRQSSLAEDSAVCGFDSLIPREEMRCLALISHNNMKEEMRKFVTAHKEVLKSFRLTGTASTMKMLADVLGTDDLGGFECSSGPLGGDAQVGAFICLEQVGGVIFFTDPLSAHPHQADVDFLHRVINQHSVLHATNPSGAHAVITILERAVRDGKRELIPSFFQAQTTKVLKTNMRVTVGASRWMKRCKRDSKDSTDSEGPEDDGQRKVDGEQSVLAKALGACKGAGGGLIPTTERAVTVSVATVAVVATHLLISLARRRS